MNLVILTGAGVSAESGVRTFRDHDGLWENHRIEDVATPAAWHRDPELVLRFYNERRRQLDEVQPNAAHLALAELEQHHDVHIITQNVDDLHERAGSTQVLHLHGQLKKMRGLVDATTIYDCDGDIALGDKCPRGSQLRPHIVWFGEEVPAIEQAVPLVAAADAVMIVGTSMQVYPAAGLVGYAPADAPIYYVDPRPSLNYELERMPRLTVIAEPASAGVPAAIELLQRN